MSGGGYPPDNSVQLEQMRQTEADRQRQADAAQAAQDKIRLAGLATAARSSGTSDVRNYFRSRGLDPKDYSPSITDVINSIYNTTGQSSENPGASYSGAGERAYQEAQDNARIAAQSGVNRIFTPNLEYTRIPSTMDDPTLTAIEAEQRQTADQYLNNLLSRGVINPSGYSAGEAGIEKQVPGVMARLNEIGQGVLETGRQSIRDVGNRASSAATNLQLGTAFDPTTYSSQLDQSFADWVNNLGTSIRGKVGTSNFFDTSGLAAIAGAGQGATNTAYDPKALAGIMGTDNTKDDTTSTAQRTGSTGIF